MTLWQIRPFFIHFLKRICQYFPPRFSLQESKKSFLLQVHCDLPSFNTTLEIHQIQTVNFFPVLLTDPQLLLMLLFKLSASHSSLLYTFVCTEHWFVSPRLKDTLLWFDIDLGKWLHAYSFLPFILWVEELWIEWRKEPGMNVASEFPLDVWTCLLLKFKCKFRCERSQRHDWNMWAAGCQLVPHFKWGSIRKLSYTQRLSSYHLWYQRHRQVCRAAFHSTGHNKKTELFLDVLLHTITCLFIKTLQAVGCFICIYLYIYVFTCLYVKHSVLCCACFNFIVIWYVRKVLLHKKTPYIVS